MNKTEFIKAIKRIYAEYGDCIIKGNQFWFDIGVESHVYFSQKEEFSVELKKDQIIVNTGTERIDMNDIGTTLLRLVSTNSN